MGYCAATLHHVSAARARLATPMPSLLCPSRRRFNIVLMNEYGDGSIEIGWHADNQPDLDHTKGIATLVIGVCLCGLGRVCAGAGRFDDGVLPT